MLTPETYGLVIPWETDNPPTTTLPHAADSSNSSQQPSMKGRNNEHATHPRHDHHLGIW